MPMRVPYITSPPFPIPGDSTSSLARFKHNLNLDTPMRPGNATAGIFGDTWREPAQKGLAAATEATAVIAQDMLRRKNEITAKNAFAALSAETDDFLHKAGNAIFKRRGTDAFEAVKDTRLFYEKAVQKHGKGLHPEAQRLFSGMALASRLSTQTAVGRHAGAEFMKAHNAADAAAITAFRNTALLAFTDDRVFNDNRQRMLEQVAASARRLGQNEEQVAGWVRQMDSDVQRKRAEAFLASGNPDKAEDILQSGELRPVEAGALSGKLAAARQKEAFDFLACLPEEARLETLGSPEKMAEFGFAFDERQMREVHGKLRVLRRQEREEEEKARQDYEKGVMTRAAGMAFGLGPSGARDKPDRVGAYQLLLEAELEESVRAEALQALEQGTIGRDDPAFVLAAQRRLASGEAVTDAELARAVACGRLSPESLGTLEKLRMEAKGPRGTLIADAFKALKEASGTSMLLEGTPGQAVAQLKAQEDLLRVLAEARSSEEAYSRLDPRSPEYALSRIVERHRPGVAELIAIMKNRLRDAITAAEKTPAPPEGESLAKAPSRLPDETPQAYLNRIRIG